MTGHGKGRAATVRERIALYPDGLYLLVHAPAAPSLGVTRVSTKYSDT